MYCVVLRLKQCVAVLKACFTAKMGGGLLLR